MADICGDSGGATDIVQAQGSDERVGFEQKRERLADSSARAKDSNLGVTGNGRGEPTAVDRKAASGVSGEHFSEVEGEDKGLRPERGAFKPRFAPSPTFSRLTPMDIDKVGRVRSYVHAQLAFVPFYGADLHLLGPGDSPPETFSLQTPILTARNPLVTIQQEFDPPSASVPLEVRGLKDGSTQADPTRIRKPTENQKKRPTKNPLGAKQRKRLIGMTRNTRTTPDPDPPSDPAEELTPIKGERRRRHEKSRFPTGLSFLYGFAPQNVGPSRLTVGHFNFFGTWS